jgi:hypothetical protein
LNPSYFGEEITLRSVVFVGKEITQVDPHTLWTLPKTRAIAKYRGSPSERDIGSLETEKDRGVYLRQLKDTQRADNGPRNPPKNNKTPSSCLFLLPDRETVELGHRTQAMPSTTQSAKHMGRRGSALNKKRWII